MAFFHQEDHLGLPCFFQLEVAIQQCGEEENRLGEDFLLPSSSLITAERPFASVRAGWSFWGLRFLFTINKPFERVVFPRIDQGDAVEIFIDTRDVKTSGFNTRFCHHFFFLPEIKSGVQCGEKTHFRGEERHALCDPENLFLQVVHAKKTYEMAIGIPAECLVGYDPEEMQRFGFTYRIHRVGKDPMHFSSLSQEFQFEEQPSLWARAVMV